MGAKAAKNSKMQSINNNPQKHLETCASDRLLIVLRTRTAPKQMLVGYSISVQKIYKIYENLMEGKFVGIAMTPDKNKAYFTGPYGMMKLLDLETQKEVHEFGRAHDQPIHSIEITRNG